MICIIAQSGALEESNMLLYYLTNAVKINSKSGSPGRPRRVREMNFVLYLPKLLLLRCGVYNPAAVFTPMGFGKYK